MTAKVEPEPEVDDGKTKITIDAGSSVSWNAGGNSEIGNSEIGDMKMVVRHRDLVHPKSEAGMSFPAAGQSPIRF